MTKKQLKPETKTVSIQSVIEQKRANILRVNHEYQRGLSWTDLQKLMFIDSIFRGYPIPAFYFHKIQESAGDISNTFYDIIDGQQRIDSIYSYFEGAFALLDPSAGSDFRFPNFVKDAPCPWAGKRFEELAKDLKEEIKNTEVVVYVISSASENEIRDLFIRLQGGTPLTPQDKRDSWPGNFTEFVLKNGGKSGVAKWYGIPVFKENAKVQNESKRRQLVAQIFMQFWSVRKEKKFCDLKSVSIDQFYHQHVGFCQNSEEAKRFGIICKKLHEALNGQPKIAGHYLIHLFILVDCLLDEYLPTWSGSLGKALFEFDRRCREASKAAKDDITGTEFEKYWQFYAQWTRTNSDIASTIQRRHAFFSKEMSGLLNLKKVDGKRTFTEFERNTVFFRDQGQCQYCKMLDEIHKISWDECEIHHILPHAKGGVTNTDNAVLMHKNCHPKSAEKVEKFREYWINKSNDDMLEKPSRKKKRQLPPGGTKIRFEWNGLRYSGIIENQAILLNENHKGRYKSFSEASRSITHTSRNGWKDWDIQLPGTADWMCADDWRIFGANL